MNETAKKSQMGLFETKKPQVQEEESDVGIDYEDDWDRDVEYSAYTQFEISEAETLQNEIYKDFQKPGKICFEMVSKIWEFKERKLYQRLGHGKFEHWLSSIGYSKYSYYRFEGIFKLLTVKHDIPIEEYQTVDQVKLLATRPLLETGASNEEIREALEMARELTLGDCRASVRELVWFQKKKCGEENVQVGVLDTKQTIKDFMDPEFFLKRGYYEIKPLDEALDSPTKIIKNGDWEPVSGVRCRLLYHREDERFILYV